MKSATVLTVLFVCSAGVGSRAYAQTNAVDHARQIEADARFAAAVKLHDAGKNAEARAQLEQAYALAPEVNILFNLAREEQLTGDAVSALRHYRACLNAPRSELTPELLAQATRRIAELTPLVAHIEIDAPPGATELTVDGVTTKAGQLVDVAPGRHVVQALIDGQPRTTEVTATINATVTAHIVAPPHAEAQLTSADSISSPPLRDEAQAPPNEINTPKWITVGALGVAGVTFVVLGAAYWGAANSAGDDVAHLQDTAPKSCSTNGTNPACTDLDQAIHRQQSDQHLRTAFLATGAVLLASAGVTAIVWKNKPAARAGAWRLDPNISPNLLGATVHVSF